MAFPFQLELTREEDQCQLNLSANSDILQEDSSFQNMLTHGRHVQGMFRQIQQDTMLHQRQQQRLMQMQLMQQQKLMQPQITQVQQKMIEKPKELGYPGVSTLTENIASNVEQEVEKVAGDKEIQNDVQDESELTTMKYHGAEQFLKEEIKQVVMNKATEETLISILHEQEADLIKDIDAKEKLVDELKNEDETLRSNAEISKTEIKDLQKRLFSGQEIFDKIENIVKDQKTKLRDVQTRLNKLYEDAYNHNNLKRDWQLSSSIILAKMEDDIKMKNAAYSDFNNKSDDIDKEILDLQQKIAKSKEYLEILSKKDSELDMDEANDEVLEDLKLKVVSKLNEVAEIVQRQIQITEEQNANFLKLNDDLERRKLRLEQLKEEKENMVKKNDDVLMELEKEQDNLSEVQNRRMHLETEISEMKTSINDDMELLRNQQEEFKKQESIWLDNIAHVEKSIADCKMNYNEQRQKLEKLNREYASKMEEKANLLLEKFALDKELLQKQADQSTLETLEKKITKNEGKTKELDLELKKLEEDTTVQVLMKEKAYLESSMVYVNEKLENLKKSIESESFQVKGYEDEIAKLDERINGIQKECENMETEINTTKDISESTPPEPKVDVPVGILKSRPSPKKLNPISPKKVQFDQSQSTIHKYEKESSESNIGDHSQPSAEKIFDQLFAGLKNMSSPKNNVKRKFIDLDD